MREARRIRHHPRLARREARKALYVSAAHKRAWRYAPIAKLSFTIWGLMATAAGLVLAASMIMSVVAALVLAALVAFF